MLVLILITILLVGCRGQDRGGVNSEIAAPILSGVLGNRSGSLEYWGKCDSNRCPDFPKARSHDKGTGSTVRDLQEVFGDDSEMRVREEPDRTIRMVEADVPQDLLNVKIRHISFDVDYGVNHPGYGINHPSFEARMAVGTILAAPEVKAFMKDHGIGLISEFQIAPGYSMPSPMAPHVSGNLDGVTLSSALDYVSRTFPGFWIYENCQSTKHKRTVFSTFYPNSPG